MAASLRGRSRGETPCYNVLARVNGRVITNLLTPPETLLLNRDSWSRPAGELADASIMAQPPV